MRRRIRILTAAVALTLGQFRPAAAATDPATVTTCFTPAQSCVGEIVGRLNRAAREIRVQAYGFTSAPILAALAGAKRRGVDVAVILDRSAMERRNAKLAALRATGVPVWVDATVAIAHSKVIVIDRQIVIEGSYNYTSSAERRNSENVTIITSASVAQHFLANWDTRRAVSRSYLAPSGSRQFGRPLHGRHHRTRRWHAMQQNNPV